MSARTRINPLPLHLANQIAAGEVIERPASVVKELVENSIDAGADDIHIDIEGAGSQLIRVRDNGIGIHPDDLALSLSRHATSKLHTSEQLSQIASLGFRGEALPSITSISRLTITSLREEHDTAWKINGQDNSITPAAHPQGTSIEVRELFFNLPARRHFLRSNKTEQHHILTTLQRLALSQFEVGFNCKISDNLQLKLPQAKTRAQQQQRIAKICGKNFVENSVYLQQDYNDISLSGWLGKPEAHRPQTDVQHFFINGRVIRDRVINHAIRQAFADSIPAGRQPAYVLYLTMPLDSLDINVHPTKHEVRFREARLIHGLITTALQEALANSSDSQDVIPEPEFKQTQLISDESTVAENTANYDNRVKSTHSPVNTTPLFEKIDGLLHQRYAIVQSSQGPVILDLITADQNIKQQQLQEAVANNSLSSRPILVPVKLELSPQLLSVAEQSTDTLNIYGIELQQQSNYVLIKRIPSLLAQSDLKQLITDVLQFLHTAENTDLTDVLNRHINSSAALSIEQAKHLLLQLDEFNIDPKWCVKLDQQTLDGLFSGVNTLRD